jgi:hypothetical protein
LLSQRTHLTLNDLVKNAWDQMRITYACGMKILSKIFIELAKEGNLFYFIGNRSPTSGKLMQRNLPLKISKNLVLHQLVISNKKILQSERLSLETAFR